MTGVAVNGEKIICEDNNGLQWEPVQTATPQSAAGHPVICRSRRGLRGREFAAT